MKLSDFKNIHAGGCRAYIIGKGPSLDRIEEIREQLNQPCTAIFCCNESIRKIEELGMCTWPCIYVVQQDSELEKDCVPRMHGHPCNPVHFMNEFQHSPGNNRKEIVKVSPWNPNAVLYGQEIAGNTTLTAIVCVRLAKYMGIEHVSFCCFDSWSNGWKGSGEYAKCIGKKSGERTGVGRHAANGCEILRVAQRTVKTFDIVFPEVIQVSSLIK